MFAGKKRMGAEDGGKWLVCIWVLRLCSFSFVLTLFIFKAPNFSMLARTLAVDLFFRRKKRSKQFNSCELGVFRF